MSERRPSYPLRLEPPLLQAVRRIASRERRSTHEQIAHYIEEGLEGDGVTLPSRDTDSAAPPG